MISLRVAKSLIRESIQRGMVAIDSSMSAALSWGRRYGGYVAAGALVVLWALLMCAIASVICVLLYLP